ncbi:NAD-dependent epimerase/dehydratase family protein [Streptomyces sp. GTA36]
MCPNWSSASSSSIYGSTSGGPSGENDVPRPASPYAVTKLAEEQLCLAHAARGDRPISVVALRYFSVYGPRQRSDMFAHRALKAALTGQPLRLYGDGHQRRDFTYIDDAVAATAAAAAAPNAQGIINVGGGSNVSLLEVINIVESLVGRDIQIHTDKALGGDVPVTRADPRRANEAPRLVSGSRSTRRPTRPNADYDAVRLRQRSRLTPFTTVLELLWRAPKKHGCKPTSAGSPSNSPQTARSAP